MDFGIQSLATLQTLIFCLFVYAVVFCLRKIAEGAGRKWDIRNNFYWREVALPVLPALVGAVTGVCFTSMAYPEGFGTVGARSIFGLVCGFASGLVYKIALSIVRKLWLGATPPQSGDE